MKRYTGWAVLGVLLMARAAFGVNLQFLERFALADDRAVVLQELVPGTEDYYYFTCLHKQEAGDFAAVDELLVAWAGRHGESPRLLEIRNRQALLRYPSAPEETLAYLKSRFGLSFDHQRQVPGEAPDLPTALDPALISRETLMRRALEDPQNQDTVDGFRPRAYDWLLAADLSPARLRDLLGKLKLPDHPRLPELIAKDLNAPNSRGFGSQDIHGLLTREQLDALLSLQPDLLNSDVFIGEYLRRLLPGNDDVHWRWEPEQMGAYLERLWDFVQRLAPAHTSLKAHVLYHRLKFDQQQGVYDRDRFRQYIQIPRVIDYINPDFLEKGENARFAADLGREFGEETVLPPVRSDEELVRAYLQHFFINGERYNAFTPYIRESYLRRLYAETQLLRGEGDLEQWYAWLDPSAVEALKNRVDVAFAPDNKQRFGVAEPVSLDVWVKNVDRLLVKVFEIDTKHYYQQFDREINTAIELDGLVANAEQVHTYTEAPLRRVRRTFDFPELTGRGVWVIELVGNGTSSRAIVAKGALQYASRTGPAGQVFTVFDERGKRVPDASIWFSGRTYEADDKGEITLPFSTDPGQKQFLLCADGFASLERFDHEGEQYNLAAAFHIDRESLRAGAMAQLAVRPLLYLNGAPMPLDVLRNPVLEIRSQTHDGIESTQRIPGVDLANNELTLHDFRVPENLASLAFSLSGMVEPLSGGERRTLRQAHQITVNGIHASRQTAAMFLTRYESGYGVELRDKSGNPIAGRAVRLGFTHQDFARPVRTTLKTDAGGRIALGALADIASAHASSDGMADASWDLARAAYTHPSALQGSTNTPLHVSVPDAASKAVADVASLLETRHGKYVANRTDALAIDDGYLTVSGAPAGDYLLHLKDLDKRISVRLTDGEAGGPHVTSDTRILDAVAPTPLQVQGFDETREAIRIRIGGANDFTRVHVVATRFQPSDDLYSRLDVTQSLRGAARSVDRGYARYAPSRQIGDEYRYILERRFAETYPGNMLERPSLLLNPWEIEETEAAQEKAAPGEPQPMRSRTSGDAQGQPQAEPPRPETQREGIPFSPAYDFLGGDAAALYNLMPDENGIVTIPREELHGRQYLQIVATDPFATVSRYEALEAEPWEPRDLRLAKALDPERHLVEQKRVRVLADGGALQVSLTGDASVQVYDSVPAVLGLLMTLNGDEQLKDFAFVGRWPRLSDDEKRAKFSEYASHELNFFLYHKDRAFFDAVVRPYLANKYQKTFMDHWLLEDDLAAYLEPWRLAQLNLVEKVLLAKRVADAPAAITPFVRDALEMIPPDPARENRLFMAALYGGALGGGAEAGLAVHDLVLTYAGDAAFGRPATGGFGGGGGGFGGPPAADQTANGVAAEAPAPQSEPKRAAGDSLGVPQFALQDQASAREARGRYRALYRAPETTKALVETDYYRRPVAEAHAGLIPVNAFWLDYAESDPGQPFLSPHLAEASSNFTEAMLALAVLDLPFEAPEHTTSTGEGAYTIEAGGAGVAYFKNIEPAAEPDAETPVLVSQNYFRQDDRYRYEGNQRFDKFVSEEFLTGVVYGCQVTVTNPASTPLRVEVLRQVPEGALPVNSGRYTKSERMGMDAYSTARLEYFFYFPESGDFAHYPVHVSQDGALLAHVEPHTMKVLDEPSTADTTSWLYVSQQGSAEAVIGYLQNHNLNRLDLNLIRWRMKDADFFRQVIDLLEQRVMYAPELWAYAVHHNDPSALRTYLRHRDDFVAQCGPALESALLDIDPVERTFYQHIEYAPLINPRAHHLDGKWMITNAQLREQYTSFMAVLAHRPSLRAKDRLALCYYLLVQDRVGEALAQFGELAPDMLPSRVQYDYLDAYLAFYREAPDAGAAIAAKYTDYPVERWRERFAVVASQAAEIKGAASDGDGPMEQDALAAREPQLALEVKEDVLVLDHANLDSCTISFYPIDLEMLFTRTPFAPAGSNVFAGVKPAASWTVTLDPDTNQAELPLPEEFAQRHVVITAEAAGISRSDIRYASSLVAQLVERYGQVRVTRAANGTPLSKVYVKVFARMQNGEELFYRDGYTDLRGRFDYASSSTMDIGEVAEFAILVLSEEHGAKVQTAAPPGR